MTDGTMLAAYPRLNQVLFNELRQDPLLDKMIRFTVMVYDPKSSLVIEERELDRRKDIAMDLLEITDPTIRQEFMTNQRTFLPELITGILQFFIKSMEYAVLAAKEFKFWEAIQITLQPVLGLDSKEKSEALARKSLVGKEMEEDIKRIDQYYKQFFMEDAELEKKARQTFTSPEKLLQQ